MPSPSSAQLCSPGKGNEKGGVEGAVRFTKHELPQMPFDAANIRLAKVTTRSWIQLGTNFYSVPVRLVGCDVRVKLSAEHVVVFDDTKEVARHDRAYGREQMVLDLAHYLPLLRRKHRGLDRAVPVRQWLNKAPSCWRALLQILRKKEGEVDGSKSSIEILDLCTLKGIAQTTRAVRKALLHPQVSVATVRFYLSEEREAGLERPKPLSFAGPQVRQGSAQWHQHGTAARACQRLSS